MSIGRAQQVTDTLIMLNVFAVLLYSPNFMSVVFPYVKAVQLFVLGLTVVYLVHRAKWRIDVLTGLVLLFVCFVFLSASVNYTRFDNAESLYLALSYMLKALSVVMLFMLSNSRRDFDLALKVTLFLLAAYAAHGILQFLLVAPGLIEPRGNIEMMGYDFFDLGWLGIYRVSITLAGWNLVRIQSFFQEPGFLAFYILFGLVLLDCAKDRMAVRHPNLLAAVFIVAMLLTMSLTGIVLMLGYLLVKTRTKFIAIMAIPLTILAIKFIVFNENEFISKSGSLEKRLEDYALLSELTKSWVNVLFGIGLGNDALISEMRVNNFLPELVMYSSVFGFIVMAIAIAMTVRGGRRSNHIVLMVLLYAVSTPMLWSPLFLMALYIARRANLDRLPVRAIRRLSLERQT
jgi:hypothetical protein